MNNKTFWAGQAKIKGSGAVCFDPGINELGNNAIIPHLSGAKNVLDVGCGNGTTLLYLAQKYPDINFLGIDYIPEMIDAAQENCKLLNVDFKVCDAANFKSDVFFDVVIGKRLLINIKDNVLKERVINNIENVLTLNGIYLMIEDFIEPLIRINEIRRSIGLYKIKVHEFNNYLTDDIKVYAQKKDLVFINEIDYGSLYYFTSRIYNAYLNDVPSYDAPLNKLSVLLSDNLQGMLKGLCPEKMLIFQKIDDRGAVVVGIDRLSG